MSHDSGFRRNDHDSTHQPTNRRQHRAKASHEFEERMKRRHALHERLRARAVEETPPAEQ